MTDITDEVRERLLQYMCVGTGQGNANTTKLAEKLVELDPELDYTQTKIEVVQALGELQNRGEIQIVTSNWELGEEFLYICTNIKE